MKSALPIIFAATLCAAPCAHAVTILPGSGGILEEADQQNWSADMLEGARLIGTGLEKEAFAKFTLASERGELVAFHLLGVMHRDGTGTQQNLKLAKQCFERAAKDGDSLAGQELALLRFAAPENPEEFASARKQLEQFAAEGLSRPQVQLGIAHLEGYGFTADAAKAIEYLNKAAKGDGHAKSEAAFRLGKLYRDGYAEPEIKPDAKLAEIWLKSAADAEHAGATRALGEFHLGSASGKPDFARARLWFSRLERLGDAAGSFYMGQMSENGWGVEKDPQAALTYYQTAAEGNVPLALFKLAKFHENGSGGVKKNPQKAIEYYRSGARGGHAVCMYNLSMMLDGQDGKSPEHSVEVLSWLQRAAASGLTEAEFKIGERYQKGRGVTQDFVAAAAWFDRAARSKHALAQLHLGEMYENGHGVKRDYQSARRLFQLSANNGNVGGQVKYAMLLANGIGGKPDIVAAFVYAQAAALAAPNAELATKVRDALKTSMTPEQLAEAEKKLAALQKPGAQK